mgnify:CR=1 FL=1
MISIRRRGGSGTQRPNFTSWQTATPHNVKILEKKYDFYLRWDDLKISDGAKKVTGFKESVYKKRAVDPLEVLNLFESYFYNDNYYIVGHNIIGFDIFIHNTHRLLCGKQSDYSYLNRLIDTNCLAKANAMNIEYDSTDLTLWQFKLQKIRQKGIKTNLKSYYCL